MKNSNLAKRAIALTFITMTALLGSAIAPKAIAEAAARWEYQGIASTGEKVYLNLDSIQTELRGNGFFFVYQIGEERPTAFTPCDGRFQVVSENGVNFDPMVEPQSEATRKMLGRVCTYHLSQ
jgi:hypothetical protein